jgi:hypothetical protein
VQVLILYLNVPGLYTWREGSGKTAVSWEIRRLNRKKAHYALTFRRCILIPVGSGHPLLDRARQVRVLIIIENRRNK